MPLEYFIGISHRKSQCEAAAVDGWDWDPWWAKHQKTHVLTCRLAHDAQPKHLHDWVTSLAEWPHNDTDIVSATTLATLRAMDKTMRSVTLMRSEIYVDNGPYGSFSEATPLGPCLAAYKELERLCLDPPWQINWPAEALLRCVHSIAKIARGLEAHAECSRNVLFQFTD